MRESDLRTEILFDSASGAELADDNVGLTGAEVLEAEAPQMSPEELKFAARVALYGSEKLATEVTQFYRSLAMSHRAKFGNVSDFAERNRLAEELAENDAERMDRSRGRGYLQHPGHAYWQARRGNK